MIEQEYDGMWCDEFSEPMDDLDFSSEQPNLVVDKPTECPYTVCIT